MADRLRKCTVDGKAMYFHRWSDESWIVPPSPMVGGHNGGVVQGTYAIVEDVETGEISKVLPGSVKFEKVELREVSIGSWKVDEFNQGKRKFITCTACNSVIDCNAGYVDENEYDFCPYCGADMKKEVQNDG